MKRTMNPERIFSLDPGETAHDHALRSIDDAILRTNQAVRNAVEAGISVELLRHSRHHNGQGHWGDQITRKQPR